MTAKTGKSRRAKGGQGEREFFRALSELLGATVTRDLSQARDGGADGRIGAWRIEVKRQEKTRLMPWWEQAAGQALAPECWPALAYRASRQPWKIVVPLERLAPDAFGRTRDQGLTWAAEISLDAFATLVREGLKTPEIGVETAGPSREPGPAGNGAEAAPAAAETGGAPARNKIKTEKARIEREKARIEWVLRAYGPRGLEARQVALILDLEVQYVTRLLIALRNRERAESRIDAGQVHRWWMPGASAATAPAKKWAHDVPLDGLDAEHQAWTRKVLQPKPRYNPFGGDR
jgi:hypothetical protein